MQLTTALSVLALAFGGGALALTLARRTPHAPAALAIAAPSAQEETLALRLDALERENRELRARVAELEARPAPTARTPAAGGALDEGELTAAVRAELERALAADPKAPTGPDFTSKVRGALETVRLEEAREQARSHVESRTRRLSGKLPAAAVELGLTQTQQAALDELLTARYETEAGYKVGWQTGEHSDRAAFGELYQRELEAFQGGLAGILTPTQLEAYAQLDGELFPGGARAGGKK